MAQPRDYRKPRNGEMRDLLVHLPHPVKVVDGSGLLLWQNQAAERLATEPAWTEQPTHWQGQKAVLLMPLVVEEKPSSLLADLQAENERLRRHQRDTARRKKKAEDTAKQSEKTSDDAEKREQKLRAQLAASQQRIAELEAQDVEPSEDAAEAGKGKSRAKGKARSKATAKGKGKRGKAPDVAGEELDPARELRQLEEAQLSLRSDLSVLRESEELWLAEKRELLAQHQEVLDQQRQLEDARQRLEESNRELASRLEEIESERQASELPDQTAELETEARLQEAEAGLQDAEARLQETEAGLQQAEARYDALRAEYENFRRDTEEEESRRQLEEQLAAKVHEFEELERAFEEEQRAFLAQKDDLQQRLSEQEDEFSKLKETVRSSSRENVAATSPEKEQLEELRGDLEEAKLAIRESTKREIRLSEKLESVQDLKEEQSKVLALVKDELGELRERERELRDTLKLYGDFRQELEQARADAKRLRSEVEELRTASDKLESRLLESRRELAEARSAGPVAGGLALRGAAPTEEATTTVRSQLEFAQKRLRDTEKQLDETREALRKARAEAHSSKDTEKLAFQDTLTGLPNRHIVDRYLDFSHKQAKTGNRAYSLFLIDIDGFRVLNETFGRDWGDALLIAVAERLAGMRGANHIFARHSQDRFLLLAADLAPAAAEKFVEDASRTLLDAMAHPFEVKGETIKLTGSIGIALGPSQLDDPREMFAQAEVALAASKARGAGSYFLHNEALEQKAIRDNTYLRQMQQAISRQEIQAVYQPVFNLNKGLVTGAELLLRWNHRDQRVLRPDDFLEVAIRSGLIFGMAEAIWPGAFKALARWRKLRPGVTLSVNLSDRELLSPKLVERSLAWAGAAHVDPSAILFEVRDDSRLRLSAAWWRVLGALHEAGFGLVLDDYGSEASLFGTLAYSGFRQAKLNADEKNPVCTPAPNAAKGVLYCAKGVQARFDQKALKRAGFDLAQGFAVARPLDEDDVDGVFS